MKKLIFIVALTTFFYNCNNENEIINEYNEWKAYEIEHSDSLSFYRKKILSIYGYEILNFDGTINEDKRNEVDPYGRDTYFTKYTLNAELLKIDGEKLIELEKKLPEKFQDSLRISQLEEMIESDFYFEKYDSVAAKRQIELIIEEIKALKNKKYE